MNRLAAAAAAAAAAAVTALFAAAPASASTLPVVYGANDGWHHPEIRPASITEGEGGSPYVTRISWQDWAGSTAYGRATLHLMNPACTPTYLCAYHSYPAGVWLHEVRTHDGRAYFADINWSYSQGGKRHVIRLTISRYGYYDPQA